MEYIIPGIVILLGNLFSGSYKSRQWEIVTAMFGWTAAVAFILALVCHALELASFFLVGKVPAFEYLATRVFWPVAGFSLVQAVSRDWEEILKPIVDQWVKSRESD